ncbi:MAG: hypothetical protein AAB676_07890 [Verrucomicrobiota bacterium]
MAILFSWQRSRHLNGHLGRRQQFGNIYSAGAVVQLTVTFSAPGAVVTATNPGNCSIGLDDAFLDGVPWLCHRVVMKKAADRAMGRPFSKTGPIQKGKPSKRTGSRRVHCPNFLREVQKDGAPEVGDAILALANATVL